MSKKGFVRGAFSEMGPHKATIGLTTLGVVAAASFGPIPLIVAGLAGAGAGWAVDNSLNNRAP